MVYDNPSDIEADLDRFEDELADVEADLDVLARRKKQKGIEQKQLEPPDDEEVVALVVQLTDTVLGDPKLNTLLFSRARNETTRSERRRAVNQALGRNRAYKRLQEIYTPFVVAPIVRFLSRYGEGTEGEGKTARILLRSGLWDETVQEITADVFLAFLKALASGTFLLDRESPTHKGEYYEAQIEDIPLRIRTWIYSVAHNKVHDWMTRRMRRKQEVAIGGEAFELAEASMATEAAQEEQLMAQETERRIEAFSVKQARQIADSNLADVFAALTPEQREVFKLRSFGLTYDQISARTGVPLGAVGRMIKEVREEIEQALGFQLRQATAADLKALQGISEQPKKPKEGAARKTIRRGELKKEKSTAQAEPEVSPVSSLVGTAAEQKLVETVLSLATSKERRELEDAIREKMQESAEQKIRDAFSRIGSSYEEFSEASRDAQARLFSGLERVGVTRADAAQAYGQITTSEIQARLREAVIDAIRRGKRGRPPRTNDGGISYFIYQLIARLSWS